MFATPYRRAPLLAGLALFWATGLASADPVSLVNMSHSFIPGPYSAIAADPSNPDRVAVATEKGEVSYSPDGGLIASEMNAIVHRRYDAMAIRSGSSRAGLAQSRPPEEQRDASETLDRRAGTDDDEETSAPAPLHAPKPQRATRLFLAQLREGLPPVRWTHWLALAEPMTLITDIALPVAHKDMYVAGPHGIVKGADRGAWWWRVLGGPGPMQKQRDMMGMSVVVDPIDPNHVLAATDRGVYVSDDAGANFRLHTGKGLEDRYISRWYWDAQSPDLLFALDTYEVLLSDNRGRSFESVFAASGEVHDISMAGDQVLISTAEGLYIIGSAGTRHVMPKKDILGAIGRSDGSTIAITKDTLYWIGPDDRIVVVVMTSETDPYMRLVGSGQQSWLMSRHTVLRIGMPLERASGPDERAPKLLMTMRQLERAVISHTELGTPERTRLYDRWYAKALPRLVVNVEGRLDNNDRIAVDGALPLVFRSAGATSSDNFYYSVMAFWDLSRFLPGSNASNPFAFIESNLRENRKMILGEVRWRYRECASLVAQLQRAPSDPLLEVAWRSRLLEYASYLEFMSGRQVVANVMEQ